MLARYSNQFLSVTPTQNFIIALKKIISNEMVETQCKLKYAKRETKDGRRETLRWMMEDGRWFMEYVLRLGTN
jgi:hypothetical protein